jgi:hypothetical protein
LKWLKEVNKVCWTYPDRSRRHTRTGLRYKKGIGITRYQAHRVDSTLRMFRPRNTLVYNSTFSRRTTSECSARGTTWSTTRQGDQKERECPSGGGLLRNGNVCGREGGGRRGWRVQKARKPELGKRQQF